MKRSGLIDVAEEAIKGLGERWDGGGQPDGLRGAAIPLLARIIYLAQALDTLVSTIEVEAALSVIARCSGILFDPSLVEVAEELYK